MIQICKGILVRKEQERTILYYFKHSAIICQRRRSKQSYLRQVYITSGPRK